jgi:uncharacterized membrane protein
MPLRDLFRRKDHSGRCALLDTLRGFTVINMVLFHATWDLVFLFGIQWQWYHGLGAYIWQQCICWTFIFLSGFCAGLGKHTVRRGAIVFGLGAAITIITALFMPEELIVFGVLTLIGSCMLLVGLLKAPLQKVPAPLGLALSLGLFVFTRPVNGGAFGLLDHPLLTLPDWLYRNYVTAYFGFPQPGFFSTDYFSLLPWLFLFLSGFYLHRLAGEQILQVKWKGIRPLNFIGRHALEIYVVHQPVIYGLLLAWNALLRPLF